MNNECEKDTIHSGSLKRFEKRKSRHAWTERWAVLGSNSLRLFTNYESFLDATEEPKLIMLTADTLCESVNKKGQAFQFKIYNGDTFVFRCESESSRQEWLSKLGMVLSGLCRNSCFHCSGKCDQRISIISDSGYSDRSSQSSIDGSYSLPGDIVQSTFNSKSTNISRHSTGYEDQITVKSPLKIYDTDQKASSSFNKTENQTDGVAVNVDDTQSSKTVSHFGQEMKNEKSPKNSFGYSFETDATDNVTASSLKLFDNQKKRFSTFSKRSSLERFDFANPNFEPENESFATELPEIPKRISKVYDAPLDYDVPALSKNDPRRGFLKVLIGKNNWKKYQAVVEKNILVLSDTEGSPEQNSMRIELKPNIKFTLLPRRNHDHRFKMTTGSSEYFFKTLNAIQRESWIKVLTEATRTVCQMACPRCCTNASQNAPSCTESSTSQSNTSEVAAEQLDENADDVFYVGMAKPDEGITFMNLCPQETANVQHGVPEESNIELHQNESQNRSSFRSGYLKTNAIGNEWGRYWITIMDKQLMLHSSEENLDSLKSVELSPNAQCKINKRSLYDFRFTLVASAVECYEFKCVSAHDRREWMTVLEKVSGGAEQGFNAGSRISEIVIKMKENESRLEKIQQQQQQERERQKQQQPQQFLQQQQLQQNTNAESQEVYETIPAETNQQQCIPSPLQQIPTPSQQQQQLQHQQQHHNSEGSEELYEIIPADKQEQQQQQNAEDGQDVYELMDPSNNDQQAQNSGDMQDIYDDFATGNVPQHTLVPPPPQQLPPLTPPQLRKQQEQQHTLPPPPQQLPPLTPPQPRKQQQRESVEDCQEIYDDFAASGGIQQQQHLLPPPPQKLPPLTPPQKRQQQQQLQQQQQNTDEGDQELYEVLPGDNCEQQSQEENQPTLPSEDKLSELIPAENKQQQKSKEKKNKRILPHLHIKKSNKKEKKQHKGKSDLEEKQDQELDAKEQQEESHQQLSKDNERLSECKEKESISKESTESNADEPLWNFEEHIQIVTEAVQRESLSSAEDKEVEARQSKAEAGSDICVGGENKPEAICLGNQETVRNTSKMTQDVERFLTQVLGKLSNLPDDVNKERRELSERLQKFLNPPDKGVGKKKPPPPIPTEPVANTVDEDDLGEYGDVASVMPSTTQDDGQETYDDVATGPKADPEEMYDDVTSPKPTAAEPEAGTADAEELYDDVNPPVNEKQRSLSKKSNSSDTLDAKDVIEPKKASDITDKVYEGYLEKYKGKGLFKKWQRRYCVLTPLALYYYENPKDQKQKGQIILPSSNSTIQKGSNNFPEVKDKKLCFELFNNDRTFLFKVGKESELDIWIKHITAALQTDLSDEQSRIMRQKSMKGDDDDLDDDLGEGEELYETIDTMQPKVTSNSSNDSEPVEEEMYELTDQFSQSAETSASSAPAEGPTLPSRNKTAAKEATPPPPVEEEEFEKVDDDMEDYQLPDANAPKPVSHQKQTLSGSPTLPPRPNSSQDAPHLPPRGATSTPGSQKPPELPSRSTPTTPKKTPPVLPTRTTPTLTKKPLSPSAEEPGPESPAPEVKPKSEPEVITPSPPVKPKAGEQFDYNRVYVAMWNCNADDEDDLAFSRGNYLYIREKIPNSDWWVASLMDIPEIRVGLVPRNFIMPAYDL